MQSILKNACVEQLEDDLRTGKSLQNYFFGKWDIEKSDILNDSLITTIGQKPLLRVEKGNLSKQDVESAIMLHKYMPNLTETQASDKRLWAYLTHVEFKEYCMERWEYGADWDEVKSNNEEMATAIRHFHTHWFTGNSARRLERHALARLWWPAQLTFAPWEKHPGIGIQENQDKYIYTRQLLRTGDVLIQIIGRTPFWNPNTLFAILEYLRRHPDLQGTDLRNMIRSILIDINLLSGSRKLSFMPFESLVKLIEEIATSKTNA